MLLTVCKMFQMEGLPSSGLAIGGSSLSTASSPSNSPLPSPMNSPPGSYGSFLLYARSNLKQGGAGDMFPQAAADKKLLLWAHFASYRPNGKYIVLGNVIQKDVDSLQKEFVNQVEYTLCLTRTQLNNSSAFLALAYW